MPDGKAGFALWVRMLFSCLVDADFLDTEHFMDDAKHAQRGNYPSLSELLTLFNRHMEDMAQKLTTQGPLSSVNQLRADILK